MTDQPPDAPASLPARIVLETDRARKSAYLRASYPRKLAAWCFEHLDRAAGYDPDKRGTRDSPQNTGGNPHT